jgi:hypothetical protein
MPPLKAGEFDRFLTNVMEKFPGFFDPPPMVPVSSSSGLIQHFPYHGRVPPGQHCHLRGGGEVRRHLRLAFTFANLQPARQVAGGMEIVKAMARAFETAPGNAFSSAGDGKLVFLFDHENTTRVCECTARGPKIEKVDISDLEQSFTLDLSSKRKRSSTIIGANRSVAIRYKRVQVKGLSAPAVFDGGQRVSSEQQTCNGRRWAARNSSAVWTQIINMQPRPFWCQRGLL